MVATLILIRDERGDLYDQEGYLRNGTGQRIDARRAAIPESEATGATLPVLQKKNAHFGRASIKNMTDTSSDTSVEESIDTELLEAIDTAQPEAEIEENGKNKSQLILLDDPEPGSENSFEKGRSNQTKKFEKPRPYHDDQERETEENEENDRRTRDNIDQQMQDNAG
ncbi:BnaAnng10240D [Brassica napus]|uniref:BnaAnng10240D protein n=2 Tax=Brassica TaxID=3705 RepID=A0A078IHX0_BRANA|nr:BnaAnng10240D [Brassica napus]